MTARTGNGVRSRLERLVQLRVGAVRGGGFAGSGEMPASGSTRASTGRDQRIAREGRAIAGTSAIRPQPMMQQGGIVEAGCSRDGSDR